MVWALGLWWGVASLAAAAPAPAPLPSPNLSDPLYYCGGGIAQQGVDLEQVVGAWYAVEIVNHRDDGKQPSGRSVVNSCPVLYLSRQDKNMIRLFWEEKSGNLEYNFLIQDTNRPGLWYSSGPQNAGSMLHAAGTYRQFAGTVEVTKAVGTHMVLTFCSPGSELYSVVMSRKSKLPQAELRGVNKMLEVRGLSKYIVKEACRDSASSSTLSLFLLLLTLFVLL